MQTSPGKFPTKQSLGWGAHSSKNLPPWSQGLVSREQEGATPKGTPQPCPVRTSSLSHAGLLGQAQEAAQGAEVDGRMHENLKLVTWNSPAGAAHVFTPIQTSKCRSPHKGSREEKGHVPVSRRRAQDGPRWPVPGRRSLPPKGRQMRMCKESCSSSGKALEVSFAADMTVQNH